MILAAGKGERMRPLTLTTPKPLLEAGGKALIVHHLQRLKEAGFCQVIINHAWLGEQIESALGDGSNFGVVITYSREQQPLETAGGIFQALPLLTGAGQDWFLVVNGDIWCDFNLAHLTPPTGQTTALLIMVDNPPHHPDGDFALDHQGGVHDRGSPALTFSGISLLHRSLFEDLEHGKQKLAPILKAAMGRNQVKGIHHRGLWFDIGTPERLTALDRQLTRQEEA